MTSVMEVELMTKMLFEKFKKLTLTPQEAADALGISSKALEADRAEAIGIPYTRRNNKEKGQILYSITAIAKTLVQNEKKTA
ncbi:hypothetical protein [Sulfurimonas sp. NWX79]|uniref:hypothetical protein n=1 Tax=Campylobacterales TaxID=213849 RepID=UPI003204FA34|nr:hypothetical protein IAPFLPAM_00015 [Sulfurimonas phage SNW-1]